MRDLTVHFLYQLFIQHPLLFSHAWSPSMVLLGLTPCSLQLLAINLSLSTVHHGQTKAGKQEMPSTKGFQQAGRATSHCLPPGSFLQQACARPQSHCSTGEELLTDTGTHTSTRGAANSRQEFWQYPHPPPCLWCNQTHLDYFCPSFCHNNSTNTFRVKMQRLWL